MQRLMKQTATVSVIFFLLAMGCILYLSEHKVVTIENVAMDEIRETALQTAAAEEGYEDAISFLQTEGSYLQIPLPEGSKADDITIENHYMDKEMWIQVPEAGEDFYRENPLSGNREGVVSGSLETTAAGTILHLEMDSVYECHTILENGNLYISFLSPREVYDRIVVIDPACGGTENGITANERKEKDVALETARALKTRLDESDIKAYYTRMDDVELSEEERCGLGNETRADMYIRIEASEGEDTSVYGIQTMYNGEYFIPGFGNVELADCLERETVTAVSGKALGLFQAEDEDYVLNHATIPAAAVRVGYLSNAQEAVLLGREDYIDRLAEGIYNAIMKIYEDME